MPDLESEIAAQLRRQAESLPIDDQMRDRLVRRVRTHQRRRRAALACAPVAVVGFAALAAALIMPSTGPPSRLRVSAGPAIHGPPKAAVPRQPSGFSASLASPSLGPGGGADLRWVDFVSPTRGWALAEVRSQLRVVHTTNAGMNWAAVGAPVPISPAGPAGPVPTHLVVALAGNGLGANVADLYAYTGGSPLGSGGASRLYVSRDRASSWQAVDFPGAVLGIAPPPGPDRSAIGPPASQGPLWALIGSPSSGGRMGLTQLEISTDAGRTWGRAGSISGGASAGSLTRVSERRGFVVSKSTIGGRLSLALLETTDGGSSWHQVADPCGDLPDQQLSAPSASELWLACGSQPEGNMQAKSVYFSGDADLTWQLAASVGLSRAAPAGSLERTGYIIGVVAVSGRDLWLALGRGPVEVTTDQGHTWRPAFSLPSGTGGAEEVTFVDATHGWVLTSRGLWRTTDGLRWKNVGG